MTTETRRDLHADLAICSAVAEHSPCHWFVMHGTDVMSEDPPGSCELDSLAWASAPIVAEFIAEARTGWPRAIERAINAEAELPAARALLIGMRKRVVFAEDKWKRLRAIVVTNATGNSGTDINDWDVMLNVMDDIMTGGDGDE